MKNHHKNPSVKPRKSSTVPIAPTARKIADRVRKFVQKCERKLQGKPSFNGPFSTLSSSSANFESKIDNKNKPGGFTFPKGFLNSVEPKWVP